MKSYIVDLPGLADCVASAAVDAKHQALVRCLRDASPRLANAQVAAVRAEDGYLSRRQVTTAAGDIVHVDHETFLREALESAGSAEAAMRRLQPLDYRLSQCDVATVYVASDNGGPQDNVLQACVHVEDERIDRRLFSSHGTWRTLRDVDDLREAAEEGEPVAAEQRVPVRPVAYRLVALIDIAAFVREAEALDRQRRANEAGRRLIVTDLTPGQRSATRDMTIAELDPDRMTHAWRGRRLVDDWAASSAGRSGARLAAHWSFQCSDYTNPTSGERWMDLIPVWVYPRKLAEVAKANGPYELFGKLEQIDRRVGVPWAWYFWMLHGNRVHSWAGDRILEAAEKGLIVLPEHDYQVLRRWGNRPYGF